MTEPFDWAGLVQELRIALYPDRHLRERIEAAFVPVERYAEVRTHMLAESARAEAAEARVKALEEALVEAAIPLEAMRIANVTQTLCAKMREGIETAVQCIRAALGGEHDK